MAERQGGDEVRAYLEYFRDMGIYDFYRNGEPRAIETAAMPIVTAPAVARPVVAKPVITAPDSAAPIVVAPPVPTFVASAASASGEFEIPKLVNFNDLVPLPAVRVGAGEKASALEAVREWIGDCTRCPLAYAGRRKIVFGDGDPNARLMFVGEGPGAEEDEQGLPFVGKSGQLLNNMIGAMGLRREDVYVANVVKCRPPANRAPEWIEASTCTQFLVQQMDIVQPQYVVALGTTAAAYVLGVKQSLASLRGRFHEVRGAKLVVTYHPAFLLRDPRQKGEAWKDLQMVMAAMGLKGAAKG